MCPSYLATRDEKDSTRGRARVLQELANGSLVKGFGSAEVAEALDLCLSCKGCSSDCPAGRGHGHLQGRGAVPALPPAAAPAVPLRAGLAAPLGRAGRPCTRAWPTPCWATRPWPGRPSGWAASTPAARCRDSRPAASATGSPAVPRRRGRPGPAVGRHLHRPFHARGRPGRRPRAGGGRVLGADHRPAGVLRADLDLHRPAGRRAQAAAPQPAGPGPGAGRRASRSSGWSLRAPPCCAARSPNCCPKTPAPARSRAATRTLAELLTATPGWEPPDLGGVRAVAQPHCHQHAVMGWQADAALLASAGAQVDAVGGCCGLAGNFGVERGHYDVSKAVAETALLPAVRNAGEDAVVLADGFSCRTQLDQLGQIRGIHLAQLLASRLPGRGEERGEAQGGPLARAACPARNRRWRARRDRDLRPARPAPPTCSR